MFFRLFSVVAILLLVLGGCARSDERPAFTSALAEHREPVTILVSIDGFRPDYLKRGVTPHLSGLAAAGVAASMRPSFPTNTFPNHWAIVTGARTDRHGLVEKMREDGARPGETFTLAN